MEKIAWGKPGITMGKTGSNDAMSSEMKSVGTVKEDSTLVDPQDGGEKELYGEGHELVASEEMEGYDKITFDVIEADLKTVAAFYGETIEADGDFTKKTTVVKEPYSVQIDPSNIGAVGYKAPKCSVKIKSTFTAKEGWLHKFELKAMKAASGEFSTLYKKKAAAPPAEG